MAPPDICTKAQTPTLPLTGCSCSCGCCRPLSLLRRPLRLLPATLLLLLAAAQVRAQATCAAISDTRTDVTINGAGLRVAGPLKVPLGVKGTGFVDWLYLDDGLRVTRGSKGSLFVHVRDDEADV